MNRTCPAFRPRPACSVQLGAVLVALASCNDTSEKPRAPLVPLSQLEAAYGPLVTAGNHPTPDQHGTGDRIGLFQEPSGTLWGLPLSVAAHGAVLGCAPAGLREAPVTDTLPAGTRVIGLTNEPTGWRGGTGELELLLRTAQGELRWQAVKGGEVAAGAACWAQEVPGPRQRLRYYRLAIAAAADLGK